MKVEGRRVGPLEPHDATPMTRDEFNRAFRDPGVGNAPITVTWDDIKRIAATIDNGGWAADQPTPADLDAWAARKVMGWTPPRSGWALPNAAWCKDDTPTIRYDDWRPSQNLGQALECVAEIGKAATVSVDCAGRMSVSVDTKLGRGYSNYPGPYDEAHMAEVIMRRLHAELA